MWLIRVAFPAEHCTGASTHTVREERDCIKSQIGFSSLLRELPLETMIELELGLSMIEALRSYQGLPKTSRTALVAPFFIPNEIDSKKCPSKL